MKEKKQWYYIWAGYGGVDGDVHESTNYVEYPEDWSDDIIRDSVKEYWASKGYRHRRRWKYGFDDVDKPPDEWIQKEIDSIKNRLDKGVRRIGKLNKLLENGEREES